MSDINYEKVLEKIARASGLSKEEIGEKVKAKRAKLSELISYEGAAQIVAAELGINFENEKLKINELLPGMRKVNVVGKIIDLFPVRTFKSKKGEESKVVNFVLADDTSNMKIVLDDGTGTIRAVLFHENLPKIGLTELDNIERLISQREDLLGKEMFFSGNVRMSKFFNEPEFVIDQVSDVNLENLIENLK